MTRSERPYSRIYHEVMDDAKFDGIREDVRHFGTWALLLVVGDMAWPAPAYLPPVPRRSVDALSKAGLVDVLSGGRFRIHGMDRERGTRTAQATEAGRLRASAAPRDAGRFTTGRSTVRPPVGGDEDHRSVHRPTSLDETSRDETSRSEWDAGADALDTYFRLTTRVPTGRAGEWIRRLIDQYGEEEVSDALGFCWQEDPDLANLLSRTQFLLEKQALELQRQRKEREAREAEVERQRIESMPPEQRAANMVRLRDMMRDKGLLGGDAA